MLSSIFNSDRRQSRWTRATLVGLALAIAALAMLEAAFRAAGSGPTVVDNERLWSTWRREADRNVPGTLILLGSSRLQAAFSIPTWEKLHPSQKVAQLSVSGGNSLPLLEDIATNTSYSGPIICEFDSWHLLETSRDQLSRDFVGFYQDKWFSPFLDLEVWLRAKAQSHAAFLRPSAELGKAFKGLLKGRGFKLAPFYVTTYYDRSTDIDYSEVDVKAILNKWVDDFESMRAQFEKLTEPQFQSELSRMRGAIATIEKRGGRVILLRLPTSGRLLELDEQYAPRKTHWDRIVEGQRSIHFADVPEMRALVCPEGSHLDVRDKGKFTAALAKALEEKKYLP